MDDFSRSKQPSQTQVTTFYTSIEPWIRPVKEEDVGFLEYTADETEPFIVPPLGKHYAEVWAEEDMHLYDRPLPGTAAAAYVAGAIATPAPRGGPLPRWEPSTLAEHDLLTEERGHGPLTERLVSALLPAPDPNGWKGVKAAEEAMEGRSAGGANAAAERDKMTVADLEDRIKDSMRFLGLLDDKVCLLYLLLGERSAQRELTRGTLRKSSRLMTRSAPRSDRRSASCAQSLRRTRRGAHAWRTSRVTD